MIEQKEVGGCRELVTLSLLYLSVRKELDWLFLVWLNAEIN